jgi:hypothetical protein
MINLEIPPLPYSAPDGYYYEYEEFKHNVVRIWLCNNRKFDYNLGASTRTIHSFYNKKRNKYYAPINVKTVGKEVDIKSTRNYTAMPVKPSPLDAFFA